MTWTTNQPNWVRAGLFVRSRLDPIWCRKKTRQSEPVSNPSNNPSGLRCG